MRGNAGHILPRKAGEGDRPKGGGGGGHRFISSRVASIQMQPEERGVGSPLHHPSGGPPPPFHGGGYARPVFGKTICIVASLAALALSACKEEALLPLPPRPVLTLRITPQTSETFGPFASTVEARYQTQLGFQVAGRMVARNAYVGDSVKAGQRLAALDPTIIQFNLTRARADVADAEAQVGNAQGAAQRAQTLITGGNTTQATLDNAVAARDTANARLNQAKAALMTADDQLGYTELRAAFDGVVTAWSAEVGQYVTNGQAVVTVARPDVREAVVDIPDNLISRVKPGMEFSVELQSAPQVQARAKVREIGPLADATTRTRRVRMTLEKAGPAFRLGTMLSVAVSEAMAPTIRIPATAVLADGGKHAVWLLDKDGAHVARREIGLSNPRVPGDDDVVQVASGLAAGDEIVVVGVHSLTDGQAVAGGKSMSEGAKL